MFATQGFADSGSKAARQLFERVNYQHLAPYINAVKQGSEGKPTFKNVHDLLTFDRRFQASTFKYIGIFETQLRAAYVRAMAGEHGAFALYDASLFLRRDVYEKSMTIHEGEISRKARHDHGVAQALGRYGGKLPVWLSVELMSLGTLSKFFSNTGDKATAGIVLDAFGAGKKEFSSWLRTVTEARNAFAHFDPYLVRRQIPSVPLGVKGASLPATSPLYIVVLLHRLLDSPSATEDPNTRYAERLLQDTLAVLDSFFEAHGDRSFAPGIPDGWRAALGFWDRR